MTARNELDARTLEALYARLEKPVFNVVYRWLWNTEEARDVTQEAFLKVWQARERVEATMLEPLVFRSAMNLAANRLRAKRLWGFLGFEPKHENVDEALGADAALDVELRRAAVRDAIASLPEKLKAVVVMCELSGLSYEQISSALKIPVGTVGSRRNLAMKALESKLGAWESE